MLAPARKSVSEKFRLLIAACLAFQYASPAFCAGRTFPDPVGYGKRIALDIKELPSKPGGWSGAQWLLAGGVVALTGGALLIDENIRDNNEVHRSEILRHVSAVSTHFGDYRYQVPIISGFWLGGQVFNSAVMKKVAADAAEASIIAALVINPTICFLTGRALPSANEDSNRFVPLRFQRYSFPSGHTSAAFALATVLDLDLRGTFRYWHTPLVYGMALAVANSRVYDQKHYLSEVILGGAIGTAIGWWIASKRRTPPAVTVAPFNKGVSASVKF